MTPRVTLTRDEWHRVLSQAREVARQLDARKKYVEAEYGVLEGGQPLANPFVIPTEEARSFLRDRIEVHIGTIQIMHPIRTIKAPLVGIPSEVEKGLEELIGSDAAKSIVEGAPCQRDRKPGSR